MASLSGFNFLTIDNIVQVLLTALCMFFVYKCVKIMIGKATRKRLRKPGTVGRCLGSLETLFDEFSLQKGGTGNICLTISLTSKQSLSHQHVHDALVWLAKRQPMLRATKATENGDKYFEIKEINEVITLFDITSSDVKGSDWKDVWFEYTAEQLGNGLLWRVVILQEEFIPDTKDYANTLMFSFNHCFIDGISCVRFCEHFLDNMNELANGATVDREILSLDMLPYSHDIIIRTRPWQSLLNFTLTYYGLGPILRFFMKKMVSNYSKTMEYNPYYAQFPPSLDVSSFAGPSRLNTKVFTENETKNILQACKANNCTVTGALTAAANLAFCELVQDGLKGDDDAKIKWSFTLDAKRFCDPKPHEDYIGLFIYDSGDLFTNYETGISDINFWNVARDTTKEIRDVVNAEGFITKETVLYNILKPNEAVELIDREASIRISSSNLVTSYGAFDIGISRNPYRLHECFVTTTNQGFPLTFVHSNHTINGRMSWQIVHDSSRVENHHAQKFASLCFGRFVNIARGNI